MADAGDQDNWTELLTTHPLFERLRDEKSEFVTSGNIMCEIRGDLFVWSEGKRAMLTTNMKRLKAHLSDYQAFQVCFSSVYLFICMCIYIIYEVT